MEFYGWATVLSIIFIAVFQCYFVMKRRRQQPPNSPTPPIPSSSSQSRNGVGEKELVPDSDLEFLIQKLEEPLSPKWETVIHKSNHLLSYTAHCFKPKEGPIQYLSVTVFENCSPQLLKDFYMDSDYRMQWDSTYLLHHQLQLIPSTGTEVGRSLKKFPLLTPREYVLAWRLWQSTTDPSTFYCFVKECEHPAAPRQKKYVRVGFFRSGWRIRKVPGRNACEIKMYHQEDAGLNVEMAKMAFARGIWSYICKMDTALRKYIATDHPRVGPDASAVSLIQKVPRGLEKINSDFNAPATPAMTHMDGMESGDQIKYKRFSRRPSKKVLANGLLLLGGIICLSRGHSSLGAKVAMAYVLTKWRKRNGSPGQNSES